MVNLPRRKGRKKFRRGHAPYLTKIRCFWCDTCNVPRIAETECSVCGSPARTVKLSPPGDPYPAMDGHLVRAIRAIDAQYGDGVGSSLLPSDKTVLLNKVPSLDAMYEVVVDGFIVGKLKFEITDQDYKFLPTLEGGRRIGAVSRQKWVSCHDGVLKYLKEGANLLVPGILGCDSGILKNDEVWVIDTNGMVIGVGTARMSGKEMAANEKGHAVKIREVADPVAPQINPKAASWDDAVNANQADIAAIEDEVLSFVSRTIKKVSAPVVVGFSGGKDSLATYLLVEKATPAPPPMFFVNTGLELPETVDYVKRFAASRGAEVIGEDAGDRFWDSVEVFGPPARDFRWCCKVLKLGPAATSISETLGGTSLSFMGQRKLESFARSIEPRVTSNPWVPGQTSANPIQNWNALEVWLYIFRENAPFNELYNRGYHRMGCYLCPASPLAEIDGLRETHPALYARWMEKLESWAHRLGYPPEWISHGFWRWKNLPPGQMKMIENLGLSISSSRPAPSQSVRLEVVKGVSPCTSAGFSLEGQFSGGVDLERVASIMGIFGKTKVSEELGALKTSAGPNSITIFSSGAITIRGESERQIEGLAKKIERAVTRALFCQSCGSCIPQCDQGALRFKDGRVSVDESKCTHCLRCDTWPCPTYLA